MDAASVRDRLFRLLDDPAISQAASEVRDEIAAMPPPGEIIERLATVSFDTSGQNRLKKRHLKPGHGDHVLPLGERKVPDKSSRICRSGK